MKIKKMMLVGLILLAVLTIGAVSASENVTSDELAVSDESLETMEVSLDDNDDLNNMENGDVGIDSSKPDENLTAISVPENDGMSNEIYSGSIDNVYPDGEDDSRLESGLNDILNDGDVNPDDFNTLIMGHLSLKNGHGMICDIDLCGVSEGTISIAITGPDGENAGNTKTIGLDNEGDGHIRWHLDDFKFDKTGAYTVNLTYSNDNVEFLLGSQIIQLVEFDYAICEDVYFKYPFDVIRFYSDDENGESEPSSVRVFVKGIEKEFYAESPFRWTLDDLGISAAGNYEILIKAYRGEMFFEDFSYTLRVFDEVNNIVMYSNQLGSESWDLDKPAAYFVCPDDMLDRTLQLKVRDSDTLTFIEEFSHESFRNWTLDDLKITRNGGYEVDIFDETGQIANTNFEVKGIISQDSFNSFIASHAAQEQDEFRVCQVWTEVGQGTLTLTVTNSKGESKNYTKDIENDREDNQIYWELKDLDICDELGIYTFKVTYNDEMDIAESNFTLTKLNFNVLEDDVYTNYPFDIIRFYDEDMDVEVYVDGNLIDSTSHEDSGWTLDDLGIDSLGDHNINIKSYVDGDPVDDFSYSISVYDKTDKIMMFAPFEIQKKDMEGPVLYILFPEDVRGTFTMRVSNGHEEDFDIDSTMMNWTLDELEIDHDDGYNVEIFDNDHWADAWLNVWCLDEGRINVWIWDSEEDGTLYNDTEMNVVSVDVPEGKDGFIKVLVDDDERDSWQIEDENRYHGWNLPGLGITEAGEYKITVMYVDDDNNEETLDEATLNVTEFDGSECRADIDFEYGEIRFWCPEGIEGELAVYLQEWNGDEERYETFDDYYFTIDDSYLDSWTTIKFYQINAPKNEDFSILVEVNDGETYSISKDGRYDPVIAVYFWDYEDEDLYTNSVDRIIAIDVHEDMEVTLVIYVNGEEKAVCEVNDEDRYFRFFLNDLDMNEAGEYDITVECDGEIIDITALEVVEFDESDFRAEIDFNNGLVNFYCPENAQGNVSISVERWDDDEEDYVIVSRLTDEIDDSYRSIWTKFYFAELDVASDMDWRITLEVLDGDETQFFKSREERYESMVRVEFNCEDGGIIYNDTTDAIVSIELRDEIDGEVVVIVNGEEKAICEIEEDNFYFEFNLEDLGMVEAGEYNITVENGDILYAKATINVVEFDGSDFRIVLDGDSEILQVFVPDGFNGSMTITVERNEEDEDPEVVLTNYCMFITDEWNKWQLGELNFAHDGMYYSFTVRAYNEMDEEIFSDSVYYSVGRIEPNIWDGETLYRDFEGNLIELEVPDGNHGKLKVIVNDTLLYTPKIGSGWYVWDMETLNMTSTGDYHVVFIFINDDGSEVTLIDENFRVVEFGNDTVRLKDYVEIGSEDGYLSLYCTENDNVTLIVEIYENTWNPEEGEIDSKLVDTMEILVNSTFYNKWINLNEFELDLGLDAHHASQITGIKLDGERLNPENAIIRDDGVSVEFNNDNLHDGDKVLEVDFPFNRPINGVITITSGNYAFERNISEMEYGWNIRSFTYTVTLNEVDSFAALSDKDEVILTFVHDNGKFKRTSILKKTDRVLQLVDDISDDDFHDLLAVEGNNDFTIGIDLFTFDGDDERYIRFIKGEGMNFAQVVIKDRANASDAVINITSGDKSIFVSNVSQLNREYVYHYGGYGYFIPFDEMDFEGLQDKAIINVTIQSSKFTAYVQLIYSYGDEGTFFKDMSDEEIKFDVHYDRLDNPVHGMAIEDGSFVYIGLPDDLNGSDGLFEIIREDTGEVIFSKALSAFSASDPIFIFDDEDGLAYTIMADASIYTLFPDNVNLTFSFTCGDTRIIHRGVSDGKYLHKINVPTDVARLFAITFSDEILIKGDESAIVIKAKPEANRQSINFELGGGYFSVYVNDVKVEDLGRINRYDGETELYLNRLTGHTDAVPILYIYLADLNISENGVYNLRITHTSMSSDSTQSTAEHYSEIDVFSKNITLTSNVKVDNVTSEVYTGFGMDPVLMYLDTYYGEIDEVTGTITVLNSEGEKIFTSDIKGLSSENGRYYLKYSDFKNKDFGDKITVMYADGNERNGNTIVDVTWKDVNPSDFAPVVNDDVNDYYGNFINMDIPALITTGQIIVTVKFNNNPSTNISNMNVSTDFGSQAVYKFNIADIHDKMGGNFAISMSDLGFYVENGDYDIEVEFTADGNSSLIVANNTMGVALLPDINITIDASSKFAHALEFAEVKIYEPASASFAELFIDDVLYSHKTFEKGLITFMSSDKWAAGMHTATIKAYNEFGSVVAEMTKEFEVLTKSEDVDLSYDASIKEGRNANIKIRVVKDGIATVSVDGKETTYNLVAGDNTVDLGILSHGNHTVGLFYEAELDDGNVTFYSGYFTISVEYESWLDMPYPIVLDDDDTVRFKFDKDVKGNVTVTIDGNPYANVALDNGTAEVKLSGLGFGSHDFTIAFNGTDGTFLSQSGTMDVKYIFRDNIVVSGYPLMDEYFVTVTLPADATGYVEMTVDGSGQASANDLLGASEGDVYRSPVINGKVEFNLKDLSMGEHKLSITYIGDNKYPKDSYDAVLNVSFYAVIGEYEGGARYVSLKLPANATGNLTVFNDNMRVVISSVSVVNGRAKINLTNLSVGIYDIRAYYEGDDYEVRQFTDSFKVMPKVVIKQGIVMGDDGNIYLDLDNATGDIVIAMDGLSPVVQHLENGIVNYTFSTEGYFYGNHSVTFLYFGRSFDGFIFFEDDQKTPIKYDLLVLPKITTGNITSDDDKYIEAHIYDDEGNIAYDANGTVSFFIDGVQVAVVDVVNGVAKLDISQFKNGNYLVRWEYSGDKKYASSSGESRMGVNHKVARITAGDLSIVYTSAKQYSVTVYTADGRIAGNVEVSFLINGKLYKKVKTNSKGVAGVAINSKPGSYKITANALGGSVTKNLKVTSVLSLKKVSVKRSAKKLVIKATLKKVDGKFLKGKKITLKFNGKKFTAKTNKKGVAKFTIKSKVLKKLKVGKKVKYQATYLKQTVKKSVKIKK